jgi:hypothetical protein
MSDANDEYPSKQSAHEKDRRGVAIDSASRTETTNGPAPPQSYTLTADSNRSADPTPSALGQGSSGSKPDNPNVPDADLDGEQMRAPGDGEIYEAQFGKTGTAEEKEMGTDLDKKKAEQQEKRDAIKASRQHGVDVDGAAGSSSGPAAVEG